MDSIPAPSLATAAAAHAAAAQAPAFDDEVPLGWECANPALQIERWGADEDGGLSGNS
jgi:hypothetical protein